jgi:hypothetical protein
MACKGSGVQIPSAPPQVNGPVRPRPPTIRPPRAANRQQSAPRPPVVRHGGDVVQHRRCRRPIGPGLTGLLVRSSRPRRRTGSTGHDKADNGLGHGTPCLQSQIEDHRSLVI